MGLESEYSKKEDTDKEPAMRRRKEVRDQKKQDSRENKFTAQEAQEQESRVLRNIVQWGGGKVKRGVAGLMLGSALIFGAGAFVYTSGGEKTEQGDHSRKQETAEMHAATLLKGLGSLPNNQKATSPRHNETLQKQAAKDMLRDYLQQGGTVEALKAQMANPDFKLTKGPGFEKLLEFFKQHR